MARKEARGVQRPGLPFLYKNSHFRELPWVPRELIFSKGGVLNNLAAPHRPHLLQVPLFYLHCAEDQAFPAHEPLRDTFKPHPDNNTKPYFPPQEMLFKNSLKYIRSSNYSPQRNKCMCRMKTCTKAFMTTLLIIHSRCNLSPFLL